METSISSRPPRGDTALDGYPAGLLPAAVASNGHARAAHAVRCFSQAWPRLLSAKLGSKTAAEHLQAASECICNSLESHGTRCMPG